MSFFSTVKTWGITVEKLKNPIFNFNKILYLSVFPPLGYYLRIIVIYF